MTFNEFLPTMEKSNSIVNFFSKKALKIEKRVRFVTSTFLLSLIMFLATFFFFDKALIFIPLLIILSFLFTFFAIIEGIEKVEWLTLFFMPVILSISFYFFYFLFPIRWLTRIPLIIIYSISIYANLLAANIFNIRVEKSLQLYRAAFSVNFFFQTLVVFLLFNSLFSFHFGVIVNTLLAGLIIFLISLQLYWTVKTPPVFNRELWLYSGLTSLILSQLVMVFSFIEVRGTILSLFLAASYYSLSGLIYSYIDQRLFRETIREYIFVWGFVFLILILSIG